MSRDCICGEGGKVAETAEENNRDFSLEKNALAKKHGFPQLKGFIKTSSQLDGVGWRGIYRCRGVTRRLILHWCCDG